MKKIAVLVLALMIAVSTASCAFLPKDEPAPESSAVTEESSEVSSEEPIRDLMTPERVEGKPLSSAYVEGTLNGEKAYIEFKVEFADENGNIMPVNAKLGFVKNKSFGMEIIAEQISGRILMDENEQMYFLIPEEKTYFNFTDFIGEDAEVSTPAETIENAEPVFVQTVEREVAGKMCEVDEYTGSEGSGTVGFCFFEGTLYGIEVETDDMEKTFIEVFALSDEVPAEIVTLPADYKEGSPLDLIKLLQKLGEMQMPELNK